MNNLFWQARPVAPVMLLTSLTVASNANAQDVSDGRKSLNETLQQINNYQNSDQNNSLSQVTNINQLRDVSPTDWTYEALRSLVDRF